MSKIKKVAGVFGNWSGLSIFGRAAKSLKDDVGASANRFEQLKEAVNESRGNIRSLNSFEEDMIKNGVSEAQYWAWLMTSQRLSIIMGLLLMSALATEVYSFLNGWWLGAIGGIGAIAISFALFAKHSLRSMQFRHRQWVSFHDWKSHPEEWLPRSKERVIQDQQYIAATERDY